MVSAPLPSEDVQQVVDTLIGVICEEMGLTLRRTRSEIAASSSEPSEPAGDRWYYIQPVAASQAEAPSSAPDSPPNLVLDHVNSTSGEDKLQQYLALGVPEIWRIDGQTLHFYQLEAGHYIESDRSTAFPLVPIAEIPLFVGKSQKVGEQTVAKAFRAWSRMRIRENRGQSAPPPPPPPPLPPLNPLL
ncbi:MAG: hypothetical protein OHK0047_15000 [Leptolyngbyaceae cyanobacterium]